MDQTPKKTEAKKGINWLNVIGLVLLILIVIVVVAAMIMLRGAQENKIVQDVSGMQPWLTAMETMTKSQIANEAAHTSAVDLLKDPTGYEGRWVVTWGAVCAEESNAVAGNIARNIFTEKNYPAFILDDGVVFVDISGEGEMNVPDGTVITGYGKVFDLHLKDVWALPIVGPNLEKEFGNVKDMEERVVFFLSKGYDIGQPGELGDMVVPAEEGAEGEEAEGMEAAEGETAGEGAEGEAVEGEEPPAEEDAPAEEPPAEEPPADEPEAGE